MPDLFLRFRSVSVALQMNYELWRSCEHIHYSHWGGRDRDSVTVLEITKPDLDKRPFLVFFPRRVSAKSVGWIFFFLAPPVVLNSWEVNECTPVDWCYLPSLQSHHMNSARHTRTKQTNQWEIEIVSYQGIHERGMGGVCKREISHAFAHVSMEPF